MNNKAVNTTPGGMGGWGGVRGVQYLVQEVGAMAGQRSTVIHYSRDVPAERRKDDSNYTSHSILYWRRSFNHHRTFRTTHDSASKTHPK